MVEEKRPEFYTGVSYKNPERIKKMYLPLYELAIKWLLEHGKSFDKLIDLGCGGGVFAKLAYEKGLKNYIGYDFSPDMIRISEENVPKMEFIQADIRTADFTNSNAFVLLEVLEHIEDDISVINNIPPKSLVIMSLPTFGAKAHVRKFKTDKSVRDRYSKLIKFKEYSFINNRFHIYRGYKI